MALVERLFSLLHDCRVVVRELEPTADRFESPNAEAERLLCYALAAALEECLPFNP